MRPLRIEPLPGAPDFVIGISRIRGEPVPVVDLGRLLGVHDDRAPAPRFVLLRAGSRRVAVRVDAVMGVDSLAAPARSLPPLLTDASAASVAALAERDQDLLFVLDAARLLQVPNELRDVVGGES
jgi:purine-binding chemotaxis protein CheW